MSNKQPRRNEEPQEETLSLFMLSSFRILRNSRPVNGRLGGKARQLLKLLAANHRKCLSKDLLIETLWPDVDPASGAISLKVAAHNLRSALDPDRGSGNPGNWLIARDGTYRLNPQANIWIDTEAFREHYNRGISLLARKMFEPARAELQQAEMLYTGDYLEEDVYEDWTLLRREELRDLHLDLLGRLATVSLRDDDHPSVIRYAHKIVLADPCREDAYQMLMKSHSALNQIARAGAWYAVCRSTLAREVAAPPSPETERLFESLFGDVSLPADRRSA